LLMGMRQRRCPRCGKRRPFNEGHSVERKNVGREWYEAPEGLICHWCYDKDVAPPSEPK